jgi:hypothetical protein
MRDKPMAVMRFAGIEVEHYPGHNPYEKGTFRYDIHEQMDKTLWDILIKGASDQDHDD